MLAAEKPDLVTVATPPGAHRDAVIAALDAGAWVWCEKPPALSLAEYDEMAAHERAGGPYVSYVFQHRFGAGAQRLRRHVEEGTLGRPTVAVCDTLWFRDPAYFAVPWRGRWETEGGGPTMGHGIHQMDLALSILGDWTEVTAVMSTLERDTETEDVSMAIVRLASGGLLSIVNSLLSPRETSFLRFDFDDATVELEHVYGYDNSHWRWTPAAHAAGDAERIATWEPTADGSGSHRAQLTALVDAMERGERPAASGADGRRVARADRRDVRLGAHRPHGAARGADAGSSVRDGDARRRSGRGHRDARRRTPRRGGVACLSSRSSSGPTP